MSDSTEATVTTESQGVPSGTLSDNDRQAAVMALQAARAADPDDPEVQEATADVSDAEPADADPDAPEPAETETSLKLRLRSDRARATQEARRDREVAAQERRALETERQQIAQERQRYERLSKLASEDPRAFIKETGLDLTKAVRAELDANHPEAVGKQALAEAQAIRAEIAREREQANQEAQQRQYAAAQERAESDFVNAATSEKSPFPLLRRMASKSPGATIQNAYLVAHQFKAEHGREASMAEIAKGVETQLASIWGEELATRADTPKSRLSPQDQARTAKAPKAVDDMTDEERKQHAVAILRKFRANAKKEDD